MYSSVQDPFKYIHTYTQQLLLLSSGHENRVVTRRGTKVTCFYASFLIMISRVRPRNHAPRLLKSIMKMPSIAERRHDRIQVEGHPEGMIQNLQKSMWSDLSILCIRNLGSSPGVPDSRANLSPPLTAWLQGNRPTGNFQSPLPKCVPPHPGFLTGQDRTLLFLLYLIHHNGQF